MAKDVIWANKLENRSYTDRGIFYKDFIIHWRCPLCSHETMQAYQGSGKLHTCLTCMGETRLAFEA